MTMSVCDFPPQASGRSSTLWTRLTTPAMPMLANPTASDPWFRFPFRQDAWSTVRQPLTPVARLRRQRIGRAAADAVFYFLWALIGLVSSIDAYLTIKYQDSIFLLEENPVGKWLLEVEGGDPSLFVGVKFLGTICVLGTLSALYRWNPRMAYTLATSLSAFQTGLLCYLFLA